MTSHKYNEPYFKLKLSELEDDKIHVLSFEGEGSISDLFEYRIRLISSDPALDASKILNKKATFLLHQHNGDPVTVHGIISCFEQFSRTPDYVFYQAVLVPQLWRLKLIYQNQIYQNLTIKDLIEKILTEANFSGTDYKIDLKGKYSNLEYVVQYRESDMDFLNRRLEHFGIFYYFDHSGDSDVVVFADSNDKFPDIVSNQTIGYNQNKDPLSEKDSITEISCTERIVTGMVQLKDYNYMFPEKQLMAQSHLNSKQKGLYYDFGDNFENENDADMLAKIRNQEFLCQSKVFYGESDCRAFASGYKFKMSGHFRDDWNSQFVVTKISSKGNQRGLFAMLPQEKIAPLIFSTKFWAIPEDIIFRPERKTPVPRISGIMSAKIESGSGDEYAFIDDHGRYKAKMLFDISDKTNGEATLPIRMTQSYSGSGYGIHFPNHAGTELLWACVDGNVDRPVGIGTIPNPSQATPVVSKNKTQNIIRTAAGNEFLMDDKKDEALVSLNTPDGNKISLDDKEDKIEIITKDKHVVTLDDKNQNIKITSKDGHTVLLDDKNTKIEVTSKEGHFIIINDKSGEEKIQISDKEKKNMFLIDINNKKLVIESKEGNIDMLAPDGEINIKSKTLKIKTDGDTSVEAANINAKANQDFKAEAVNVEQKAQMNFTQKGTNVTCEAQMEFKSKGLNYTAEGAVNMQIKGAMVTVQSTGLNTIKGMPVMIN